MKAEVEEGSGDNEYQTIRNSMKYHFPSAIITGRGAAVYSWRNKFAGATAVYNFSVAGDEDHLQVKRNKWRVRMFFGLDSKKFISLVTEVQMICLRLISLKDRNLGFGFTGGV